MNLRHCCIAWGVMSLLMVTILCVCVYRVRPVSTCSLLFERGFSGWTKAKRQRKYARIENNIYWLRHIYYAIYLFNHYQAEGWKVCVPELFEYSGKLDDVDPWTHLFPFCALLLVTPDSWTGASVVPTSCNRRVTHQTYIHTTYTHVPNRTPNTLRHIQHNTDSINIVRRQWTTNECRTYGRFLNITYRVGGCCFTFATTWWYWLLCWWCWRW